MPTGFDDLRRHSPSVNEVLSYINVRIAKHESRLGVPLLNERESDTLRGRIAELKNLRSAVQDTGEADE